MSLDYPYYEELLRRRHPAAWWWIVGDRLYYLGLIATVMGTAIVAVVGPLWLLGLYPTEEDALKTGAITILALATVVVFLPVFIFGSYFKTIAHDWGRRDGIQPP